MTEKHDLNQSARAHIYRFIDTFMAERGILDPSETPDVYHQQVGMAVAAFRFFTARAVELLQQGAQNWPQSDEEREKYHHKVCDVFYRLSVVCVSLAHLADAVYEPDEEPEPEIDTDLWNEFLQDIDLDRLDKQ